MLQLALPVVLSNLGLMLMGVVDILFVGRISATAIGAVGLGTSLFSWFMIFGVGLLAGLDYLVSFARGSGKPEDGYRAFTQGLIASTVLAIPLTAVLLGLSERLDWLGVATEVRPEGSRYLAILAWSLWPTLVFSACRQYLTAMGVAKPAMFVLLAANLVNAAGNAAFVFGRWGAPPMGAVGSALSTVISRYAMMAAMIGCFLVWDRRRQGFFGRIPFRFEPGTMRSFLRLGLPSALHMTFEVGVFALSTTLAARLAPDSLAAHQIVLNIASMTFMVPMGLGSATAVLVGSALGRGAPREAVRLGWKGVWAGTGFMAVSGLSLLAFSGAILSFFTKDPQVVAVASGVILIAALFQVSDGAQVAAAGALRGLGDTRSPMVGNLLGHWFVGLPMGLLLCFRWDWGLRGLWVGLSLGLTSVAAMLLFALRRLAGERLAR